MLKTNKKKQCMHYREPKVSKTRYSESKIPKNEFQRKAKLFQTIK